MYVSNYRFDGRLRLAGSGNYTYGGINTHFSVPRVIEGVYSWRTGRNSISDPPVSYAVKREKRDSFGIKAPSQSGSLVDRLADRKRYMEEFQRAAFPAPTDAGGFHASRTSTTDTGHLFGTVKVYRQPWVGTFDWKSLTTSIYWYKGQIWGSADQGSVVNATPHNFGFTTRAAAQLISSTDRQGMANRYFAATAPDRNVGSVGVTLIELLRGDIPSLLKNFHSMMSGYKTIRNMIGSDALNIMFGWTPLIQEYANLIRVGMNLERIVYYESFRRKRSWDGPSTRTQVNSSQSINWIGAPYGSTSRFTELNDVIGPIGGYGVSYNASVDTLVSEDYHWSSKYVGLAKAGRRANSFSDQAMDVAKRLGLVNDPQMLWDLTPYSWLVDWFTTMGDSIANSNTYSPLSGKYSVDYAYLTTQHSTVVTGDLLSRIPDNNGTRAHQMTSPRSVVNTVSRWRSRATPFGFGTQLGSLTASQYGILVALGLARSR